MKKKHHGFTLLELTIVMVLMAIIGAAVIPSMKIIHRQQIQKAGNEIGMDLMTIRKQARATNKKYMLSVDVSSHHYTLSSESEAVDAIHNKDSGNSEEINISISASGATTSTIVFQGDSMQPDTGTEIDACTIKVSYKDMEEYGELVFDNVSGKYSFNLVS